MELSKQSILEDALISYERSSILEQTYQIDMPNDLDELEDCHQYSIIDPSNILDTF